MNIGADTNWQRLELENIRPDRQTGRKIEEKGNTKKGEKTMKPVKPSRPESAKERGGVLTSRYYGKWCRDVRSM